MAKTKSKHLFFSLLFILTMIVFVFWALNSFLIKQKTVQKPSLVINDQKIMVEVAETPGERSQGLSGRESLGENEGMLFVFDQPGNYSFWMKGMKFSLDFVFFNDQAVVDLVEKVPFPKSGESPELIRAQAKFDKVLELNTGMIKKLDLKVGDQVEFSHLFN